MTQSIKITPTSFGNLLRTLRRVKDIKLDTVAAHVGMSKQAIYKMEKEEIIPKSLSVVRKIGKALGADEDELFKLVLKAKLFRCQVKHELKMEKLRMEHTVEVTQMAAE